MPNLGVGTRGCSHEKAVAPDRSAVSLLHLAEQAPAEVVGALSQLVEAVAQTIAAVGVGGVVGGASGMGLPVCALWLRISRF